MIIQFVLDWWSDVLASMVGLLPGMPAVVGSLTSDIVSGISAVGAYVEPLGVIIPFTMIQSVLAAYLAVLAYWAVVLVVRLVLWMFGR